MFASRQALTRLRHRLSAGVKKKRVDFSAPGAVLTNAYKSRWTPAQVRKLEQAFGEDRS
jgi:hypothetical protein